ncbi:MAG TPA: amidohydrolase family protein [Bryobacteraceae bacterium]|nr:amidohydrolase family protein [Bryobacteraceae bacterium]
MKCSGYNSSNGELVEIEFDSVITHVDPLLEAGDDVNIAPGFIDLQLNGFAGVDYNLPAAAHDQIARSIRAVFSTGVTRFFPTVITGPPDHMLAALRNLAAARESLEDGAAMEAFHVEGPHISPDDGPRGAHPKKWVRAPDMDEFHRWQEAAKGNVRLITLAPEWPGAMRYIEKVTAVGVVISIGHTGATPAQIRDAVSAGATLSTHLGNAGHATLPKFPNYLWTQLAEDRLAASFIADGIHLDNDYFRTALRAKGVERSILITDAVMPAMCPPGLYELGEVPVELREDGRVVLRGGTRLAGSSLRMDRAIANVMRIAGLTLIEAVAMATVNPARVGRIVSRQRALRPGERGDIVRFRLDPSGVEVLETYMGGRRVFSRS